MAQRWWSDPHLARIIKPFLKAWYWTAGVFLLVFVISHIGTTLYASYLAERAGAEVAKGLAADSAYLKAAGDAIAKEEQFKQYFISGDSAGLVDFMQQEKTAHAIGTMGATDAQGVLIARTLSPGNLGANIFLTTPQGRYLDRHGSVESVEAGSIDPHQLAMITGREVTEAGSRVGALYTNYLLDDSYLRRLRDAYADRGVELVSYTAENGIYGDSFADPATRSLIDSYFNPASGWFKDGVSQKTVSLGDGTYYLVVTSAFKGLEGSPGGLLIFIPRTDISPLARLILSLFTLLTFIGIALYYHLRSRGAERGWRYWAALLIAAAPVFWVAFTGLYAQTSGFLQLQRAPYPLYNSTLRLQPEWGIYQSNFERSVLVVADTGDEKINAVEVAITYDPAAVEVTSIVAASSTCSYVIEQTIDKGTGVARMSCVLLGTQAGQKSLPVATLTLLPKRTGTFELAFDPAGTKVKADDGLATDVLRSAQGGSYRVDDFTSDVFGGTAAASSSARSFIVFSPTHPNQSRWYNSASVSFVWRGAPGAVYRYAFDTAPATMPPDALTTQHTMLTLPVPGDGVFYFHLQLASGGPVAHYRVRVDRTPPTILAMHLSAETVFAGDVVRLTFEAEDAGSGVQRNYYVDLGNHLFLPVGEQLFVPFVEAGDKKVTLRVYDDAGNYTEKTEVIQVRAR